MNALSPKAGVIGWPVRHSRSPLLHRAWLKRYKLAGSYDAYAVPPEGLAEFIGGLAAQGFRGVNVTLPHKEQVFQLMHRTSPEAGRIKAVNTVIVGADGELLGTNTDGFGFLENLKSNIRGFRADAGPAVVLGAGGAARAIVAALIDAGCPRISVINRSRPRAETLAKDLGGGIHLADWGGRAAALKDAQLLVNSTSLGMTGQPALEMDLGLLPQSAVVNDIVYQPLMTPLLAAALARGNRAVGGIGMLLHQGRPGFAAWFGVEPAVTLELQEAVLAGGANE